MNTATRARNAIVGLLAFALAGCAAQPGGESGNASSSAGTAATTASSAPLTAPVPAAGEQRFDVDADASEVVFLVYRGGRLARLGHNHVVVFGSFTGSAVVTDDVVGSRFLLDLPFESVDIDNAERRRAEGEAFSSEPSEEDIAATRENMFGEDGLDVARHPVAQVAGTVTGVDGERAEVALTLRIHGVSREEPVSASLVREPDGPRLRGEVRIAQTDFGLTPFSVLGGALIVKDEVLIRFDVKARPAT